MIDEVISLVGVDVERDAEKAFNRWYDEQHVREVLDCPGWRWGARYKSLDGSPSYIAIYGMENEEAMWTPELQAIKGFAHFWPRLETYWGRTYKRIHYQER